VSEGSIRDRLSALSRTELVGLALLVVVLLAGAGLWYLRSLPRPVEVRSDVGGGTQASDAPATSESPSAAAIIVDVAGWVRHPGVYEFHEGDRVIDAIEAAGGARPNASLEILNLAAPLADGTQVLVSRAIAAGSPVTGAADPGVPGATGGLVNINTASASELEALPGVGEVIAQRIVDYRTANGPFTSADQLLDVSGIGESTLEEMRDSVTV